MAQPAKVTRGLQFWMERVVEEAEKVRGGFEADPVHDLRVAIRRCRSIGDGFRMLDPHPVWKKMRRAGKTVFAALGNLRDVQVQMEWVEKLGAEGDPVREKLMVQFRQREQELKVLAAGALAEFDTRQWQEWATLLGQRAEQIPVGGEVFQVIALERWMNARRLHSAALKSRSQVALHAVRIGLKKFRYIVENFLPELHDAWIKDLKEMQDVLGEIHDLDVLAKTARTVHALKTSEQRMTWRNAILAERAKRLQKYRSRMLGRESLWMKWRAGLPSREGLRRAILNKFEIWSALRDSDRLHTENLLQLSLQLFDFLSLEGLWKLAAIDDVAPRDLLTVAVLGHEAGCSESGKHHKAVMKIFERLDVPPGWSPLHMQMAGLIARYHTGAPPSVSQRRYASLRKSAQSVVDGLAGVIRLADAVERHRDIAAREVSIVRNDGHILITAAGVHDRTPQAERIGAARHLLECVCGMPIMVRPT
jgi:CHAD domain-containing protein